MLGYRKRAFSLAFDLLEDLRANSENFESLKKLQQLLILEIVRTEEKIPQLRSELRAVQITGEPIASKRSAYLKNRLEGYRQCAYVWRCFGDAIAFLYMDKHALKQVYFNLENPKPKNEAGFVTGKTGLANEIAYVEYAIEKKVPALLNDLTNTIRHGDVCLMGASDPYLVEVKTSKNLDRRGRKQKRNLEKLHEFFETDKIQNLRGFKAEFKRQAYQTPERSYVREMNDCVTEALTVGHATRTPELGIHYIALAKGAPSIDAVLSPFKEKSSLAMFSLNEFKNTRTWAPYTPFTLTFTSKENLWAFTRGDVFVIVLLELEQLCILAKHFGYEAKIENEEDGSPALRILIPGVDGHAGPSFFTMARIGMECVSPEWLVKISIEMITAAVAMTNGEQDRSDDGREED